MPGDLTTEYYAQRASAGLIISEATQISQQGQGYQDTPGIYTKDQIDGCRKVKAAVHAKGGRIFMQLWHAGRISHVDLQPNGGLPVAPSAIRAATKTFVNNGFVDVSEPRAFEIDELAGIVNDFRKAAANAIEAGFDGVEVHGANGYLLEQFAKDGANVRTDAYGGSVENRARLMLEVTAAVAKEIGAKRVGMRISPVSPANGIYCSDPQTQYEYIVDELDTLGIAYIHVVEGATGGPRDVAPFDYGLSAISQVSIRPGECDIPTLQKQDTLTLRLQEISRKIYYGTYAKTKDWDQRRWKRWETTFRYQFLSPNARSAT